MLSAPDVAVIGVLALLFFGPDQLPKVAKRVGHIVREVQNTSASFLRELERAGEVQEPLHAMRPGPVDMQPSEWPDDMRPSELPEDMRPAELPEDIHPAELRENMHPAELPENMHPAELPDDMHHSDSPEDVRPSEVTDDTRPADAASADVPAPDIKPADRPNPTA